MPRWNIINQYQIFNDKKHQMYTDVGGGGVLAILSELSIKMIMTFSATLKIFNH